MIAAEMKIKAKNALKLPRQADFSACFARKMPSGTLF